MILKMNVYLWKWQSSFFFQICSTEEVNLILKLIRDVCVRGVNKRKQRKESAKEWKKNMAEFHISPQKP